jgi:sec-independent protein translocase protein TatA|tara:strand:+ start:96 stop:284 length:189 start_codon:yes stop_codon:yes gene_type:complete
LGLGPWEIIIIFVVVLLLFGGKKLPEFARGLGEGIKEFKKATNDIKDEVDNAINEKKSEEKK